MFPNTIFRGVHETRPKGSEREVDYTDYRVLSQELASTQVYARSLLQVNIAGIEIELAQIQTDLNAAEVNINGLLAEEGSADQAAVATTAAVVVLPYGYSQAQANGIVTLLNEIRRVLVLKNIMKGSA